MFDMTDKESYKRVLFWHQELKERREDTLVVLVGNKSDDINRKILYKHITYHRKNNCQYYDLAVKANYQVEKPFVFLLRRLTNDINLVLEQDLDLHPRELEMSPEIITKLQTEKIEEDASALLNEEEEFECLIKKNARLRIRIDEDKFFVKFDRVVIKCVEYLETELEEYYCFRIR